MLKLNKKTEVAVSIINYLASYTRPISAAELAPIVGTTPAFVAQIANRLSRANLIHSRKGPKGGYTACQNLITLAQVFKAMKTSREQESNPFLASFYRDVGMAAEGFIVRHSR